MSRTGRMLLRGAGVRVLANFAQMAVALCLTPYVLRTLGDHYYGFWVLVASLLGFYGLLDLGISSGVARFTSRALGKNDEAGFRTYFASSFWLLCGIGASIFVLTFGAAFSLSKLAPTPADGHAIFGVVAIMGGALAVLFPGRAFTGLLAAHLRYDLVSLMQITTVLCRLPLVIFVFSIGYRLLGLAASIAALQLVEYAGLAFFAFRVHPGLSLKRSDFSRSHAKELVKYGFHTLVAQVSDLLRFKLSPVIITAFRTATMTGWFDLADKLNRIAGELVKALVSVLAPVFSRQDGRGDVAAMRSAYLFTCKIASYAAVLLGGMMIVFGGVFIQRWIRPEMAFLEPIMQVLVIGTICSGAQMPTVQYLFGTSRHNYYARLNLVHGVVVLGLTMALVGPYGLMGVALGSTIPTVILKFFVQPMTAIRGLEIPVARFYFGHALKNLLVPAPFVVAVWFVADGLKKPEYFNIAFLAGASCALFVPYIFVVGFNRDERSKILGALLPRRQPPPPPPPPVPPVMRSSPGQRSPISLGEVTEP